MKCVTKKKKWDKSKNHRHTSHNGWAAVVAVESREGNRTRDGDATINQYKRVQHGFRSITLKIVIALNDYEINDDCSCFNVFSTVLEKYFYPLERGGGGETTVNIKYRARKTAWTFEHIERDYNPVSGSR